MYTAAETPFLRQRSLGGRDGSDRGRSVRYRREVQYISSGTRRVRTDAKESAVTVVRLLEQHNRDFMLLLIERRPRLDVVLELRHFVHHSSVIESPMLSYPRGLSLMIS